MRTTWPSQRIRLCFSSVYMLVHLALSRTVLFGTMSCQVMYATHVKSLELSLLSSTQCRGLTTQALKIWIFVCSVSLLLFHAFFVSLVMMEVALPMRLFSSASSERVSEIVEPR